MAMLRGNLDPESGHNARRRGGAPGSGLRAVLGGGQDALAWSFPLGRVLRVGLRLHVLAVVWAVAELLATLPHGALGIRHVAAAVGALLVLSVVREAARALVARRFGADMRQVVLWPLGGLTPTPRTARRTPLFAELGGLSVTLLLVPMLAGAAVGVGVERSALLVNIFDPRVSAAFLRTPAQIITFWAFYANLILLAANLLLPMSPFDLGRVLHALARRRVGEAFAADVVFRVGLISAGALLIFGMALGETRLMGVAALAGLATWLELRKAAFLARPMDVPVVLHPAAGPRTPSLGAAEDPPDAHDDHNADPEPEPARGPDIDTILAKISSQGMGSLTQLERDRLAEETERRRRS